MKKSLFFIFMLFVALIPFGVRAENQKLADAAECAVLMDGESGRVLFEKNINEQRAIASISKIMTAVVAIEYADLESYVPITKQATLQVGSSVYLKEGDKVKLKDLLYALLLRSGNDAAYAIAEYVGGNVENFVLLMNEKAKVIGMNNSTFENPSGLDETTVNLSTAYDMALLTRYAMNNPFYREINNTSAHKAVTFNNQTYVWTNKHKLIRNYDYIIGGKTGYTKLAKRTLVSVANKNNFELIAVTLNDPNDWDDHLNLFDYGFKEYKQLTIIRKGLFSVKPLDEIFYVDENIVYPMEKSEISDFKIVIDIDQNLNKYYLELMKGNEILLRKEIKLYDKSNRVFEHDLTVSTMGERIWEYIREMFW